MYCCAHKTATLTSIQHTVWGEGGKGMARPTLGVMEDYSTNFKLLYFFNFNKIGNIFCPKNTRAGKGSIKPG